MSDFRSLYTPVTNQYFFQFLEGDEAALTHLYQQTFTPLLRYGLRIVPDEFVVSTAIQEAFLKVWKFRERMTSMMHAYRFLRLNVTWRCYTHYRKSKSNLCRYISYSDNLDSYGNHYWLSEPDNIENEYSVNAERLETVYNAIPYLPADHRTVLTLYFKYGLSYKQIARRFLTNSQVVNHKLVKAIEYLKKMIHSKKKIDNTAIIEAVMTATYPESLQGEMLEVFRLRYERKLGFDSIASQLNLPVVCVHQKYLSAHRLIKSMKAAK
jgi:RNA polymerase sigma factor (sigma-70 family)